VAKTNYGFEKRQRELARKKKQEEKRRRKLDKAADGPASGEPQPLTPTAPPDAERAAD
jgi:hypothetical protein